jgi:hypothetical protein
MAWQALQYNGAFDDLWAQCTQEMKDQLAPRYAQLLLKGNQARPPVTDSFGDGLHELRAKCGRIHIRALFGFLSNQRIVFVLGALKDQRRLPLRDIERARRLLKEAEANLEKLHVVHIH